MNFEMFNVGNGIAPTILAGRAADTFVMTFEPGAASRVGGHAYNGISGTLRASAGDNLMAVCYENHGQDSRVTEHGDLSPTITGRAGTGGGNLPLVKTYSYHERDGRIEESDVSGTLTAALDNASGLPLCLSHVVRRLTPTECERLMGFPDNWTRIPWKGRVAEECPDGPRYKACGNSWAVNCARWVMRRIELAESLRLV